MNCEQIQSLLVAYLDGEVTPSERTLIQAHFSGCTVCQQELSLLSSARSRIRSMLQRRAVHAVPSREAWSRLEAKVTEAEQLSSKKEAWFSRKAPNGNRASNPHKTFGGVSMNKRSILSVMAAVAVLAILAVFVARNVIPASASAQQILERASQVQSQPSAAQGIRHIRSEFFSNLEGKSDGQGEDSIVESYSDPASGNFRVVITDKETGTLLTVFAFDGSNAYNSESSKSGQSGAALLTVYRSPQNRPSVIGDLFANRINGRSNGALNAEAKSMFDRMRQDPHVELVGKETWDNGHTVYVLRSQQEVKSFAKNDPMGLVTLYFDVHTYQLMGSSSSIEKDGNEILISRQQILLDEVLPTGSVAWDLSDLQGINIVDDRNGEHSVPETLARNVNPVKALAAKTGWAYLLKKLPDGFSLEISVLPKQPADELFFYEAGYTNKAGDYFIIRTFGDKPLEDTSWADETYTTASGLVLYFVNQPSITTRGEEFNGGLMQALNGKTYAIESTLSREQIKALMEDLVLVK
jgi:type II secretory pathway pseudopilin PulG